jgi:hypothetical protein
LKANSKKEQTCKLKPPRVSSITVIQEPIRKTSCGLIEVLLVPERKRRQRKTTAKKGEIKKRRTKNKKKNSKGAYLMRVR